MMACSESTVRNDSICKKDIYDSTKNIIHIGWILRPYASACQVYS